MTIAWIQLLVAGVLEILWAIGLKYTDGFSFRTRPVACFATLVTMATSMYLLSQAVRPGLIPIGTGYAIWTGIGALGAAILGMLIFNEPATLVRMICLMMLVAGIVGLKLSALQPAIEPLVPATRSDDAMTIYIGTYSKGSSRGIYRATFEEGRIGTPELAHEIKDASFLAIHPTRPLLYSLAGDAVIEGRKSGGVVALAIEEGGSLRELNRQSSEGEGACHVSLSQDGQAALVANYTGATVAMLPIADDGSLDKATAVDLHVGSSVDPKRQQKAFAHSIFPDPSGRYAISCDLGIDEVIVYRTDSAARTMTRVGEVKVEPGGGPRHLAFSPDGASAYVINEMGNTVERLSWNADAGKLERRQTIDTLPADFKGESYTAEIRVHPSGRFVYGSNRGHDSIAIFHVGADGELTLAGHESTRGSWPRNFSIDPSGHFLLVSNERGGNVVAFAIDQETGALKPTGSEIKLDAVCTVVFAR